MFSLYFFTGKLNCLICIRIMFTILKHEEHKSLYTFQKCIIAVCVARQEKIISIFEELATFSWNLEYMYMFCKKDSKF